MKNREKNFLRILCILAGVGIFSVTFLFLWITTNNDMFGIILVDVTLSIGFTMYFTSKVHELEEKNSEY